MVEILDSPDQQVVSEIESMFMPTHSGNSFLPRSLIILGVDNKVRKQLKFR